MEIGSLLVPMVITSQMAFVEKWDSKYVFLKVTGNTQVHHTYSRRVLFVFAKLLINSFPNFLP